MNASNFPGEKMNFGPLLGSDDDDDAQRPIPEDMIIVDRSPRPCIASYEYIARERELSGSMIASSSRRKLAEAGWLWLICSSKFGEC